MNTMNSPLINDFEQLHSRSPYIHLQVDEPHGENWLSPQDFQEGDSHALDELMERIRSKTGCDDKHFLATSAASAYAWQVSAGGMNCFLTTGRVPDMRPENLVLHFDDSGWHDHLSLRTGRFYTLPENAYADHACAIVVENREALRNCLRTQVENHMRPVIDRLKVKTGMGKPGMWGVVADRFISILIQVYNETGRSDLIEAEIKTLINVPGSPLKGKTGVTMVTHNERSEMFLKRAACCQYYKVAEYGYCSTCPLQSAEERESRLRGYMAQQANE